MAESQESVVEEVPLTCTFRPPAPQLKGVAYCLKSANGGSAI